MSKDHIFNRVIVFVGILSIFLFVQAFSLPFNKQSTEICHDQTDCKYLLTEDLRDRQYSRRPTRRQLCEFCRITMPLVRGLISRNKTDHIQDIATYICGQLKIADDTVCRMAIEAYQTSVFSVTRNTQLTSHEMCSLALGCSKIKNPIIAWNISLPDVPKPPVIPFRPPPPHAKKIRILQLSDIHIDFEYQPGSLADCEQPLCCRNISTSKSKTKTEESEAGFWGDYRNCDIPVWTVENMFKHIVKNEKFDFIYWTGDLPPHNIWNQTRNDQINAQEQLTRLFLKYFPDKIILPTLGNHEATPCNLFPTPTVKEDNIEWLYNVLAKEWTQTGLPSSFYDNIKNGAFYSIKMAPNFRVISLNTNYCPKENFWLFLNSTDPLGQLDWLVKILQQSENNNEKVHIIGHIDPSQCLESWSANYYRIVNRYESTIVGQIFGHSHKDEISLFYDLENTTRAVSVAYLGPSVTPLSFLNPSYRIYEVDGNYPMATWQILDHTTVYLNLTEANLYNVTKWKKEYSVREVFQLENLMPESWNDLLDKVLDDIDSEQANKLFRYYSKSSDRFPDCDAYCKRKLFCSFKQARSDNFIPC
ncbi:unnamed protein product [Brachionus calyciflorus]|uniref:Sphingomyelin phosphodiesterase n=1 Tax=Brachionus calyciflorus TaxID=104777 RepID=A0A814DNU2_9BILA|nr:unnamed protein product [Brachionus calyciflorus]